jgi:tRNA1Val (adenine37-N6)-methyltransferase
MLEELPELTDGFLLDGRVRYAQPRAGYRTGIEPVLLAASVPARAGQLVLEAGCGAGAGLLCLVARVPGVRGVGVELDPGMAAIAQHNIIQNQIVVVKIETADVLSWRYPESFDHAFANPPWHDEHSSVSPSALRDQAKRARDGLLTDWIAALAGALKNGGTIGLILPTAQYAAACAALSGAGFGGISLLPLWPRAGEAARMVVLSARKATRSPARLLAGLVLHEGAGYSAAAQAVLRGGEPLSWI